MCGIFGTVGLPDAPRHVVEGLRILEYRGYDSCGVTWVHDGSLRTVKAVGATRHMDVPEDAAGSIALGHTRWATHGGVTEANAHPHVACDGSSAVVHNGILHGHEELRRRLEDDGHTFSSQTDSEVLIHLWESSKAKDGFGRLTEVLRHLEGTFSLAILDRPTGGVWFAKHRNPMWLAARDKVAFLASDAVALRPYVKEAIPLEDGDRGHLGSDGRIEIRDRDDRPVERAPVPLEGVDDRADKAGYEHFMLKELNEVPSVLNGLLARHVHLAPPYVRLTEDDASLANVENVVLLGAGTSHHACQLAAMWIRRLARVPVQVYATPEYKDAPDVPPKGSLVVAVSQSGETLDTLQTLERLASEPLIVWALTNQDASTIARRAEVHLPLKAGLEIGVAATKTFAAQAQLLYLLALAIGQANGRLPPAQLDHAARHLKRLPRAIDRTLQRSGDLAEAARSLARHETGFILAKDALLPAGLEGALKLKEIAYQHVEAFPAGELKHGPFALLTEKTPVVFLLGTGPHEAAVRASLAEVSARGAPTTLLASEDIQSPPEADQLVGIPATAEDLQPIVFAHALQLLSYWVAKARALPIDRPRNLAKSVTVE